MWFRSVSTSVIAGVIFVSGCSAGGGLQQPALPQSRAVQPIQIASQPDNPSFATATHFLYVASQTAVDIYALPLTAASKPVHTISGFSDASGVAVGTADINVVDLENQSNGINIYYASGTNALKKRCSIAYVAAYAISYNSNALYVVSPSLDSVARFADLESLSTKPQPCNGEKPVTDSNGLSTPISVGSDGKFVFVGDNSLETLDVYPIPLISGEAPEFRLHVGNTTSSIVASNTDVYVSSNLGVFIDDFKLPLKNTSVPVKLSKAPLEEPYGMALFPRPTTTTIPTEMIVSDEASGDLFVYKLPITAGETPTVTVKTGHTVLGLDAK